MNSKERAVIAILLLSIATIVSLDLITDFRDGIHWWHLIAEATAATTSVIGIFYLMRGSFLLKHSLRVEKDQTHEWKEKAEKWKNESKRILDGLSLAIDTQLTEWKLTHSEKEVAFLLLKGLSLKEIAKVRMTTEKTTRTQSIAIYSKAGLSGRSELSAFFLEDLLLPIK